MGSRLKKTFVSLAVVLGFTGYALRGRLSLGSDDLPVTTTNSSSAVDQPINTNTSSDVTNSSTTGQYKDGTYTGPMTDAFYGNIQAVVTISRGQITKVNVPIFPNDRENSIRI